MDRKELRNMDKKLNIYAFALTLLLLMSLAGCGGASDKGEPAGTSGQTSATSAPILPEPTAPSEPTTLPESPTPPEESVSEDAAIHVSTAGEFLEAIAPGVVIELAPGTYNLTEYLREASDTISDYVARGFTDGWQAEIREVERLTIRGAKGGEVEVVAEPRYSCALTFDDGDKASFGLYADQGGALQGSEEGSIWLALYLEDEVLWFY